MADLTYGSYLKLDELLQLQQPQAQPPAHDELQFIVVHQVYELWFRLMIYEVRATIGHLQAGDARRAQWLLRRLAEIERILAQQVSVMETMSPTAFLEFRNLLQPASGLQSVQFRVLEYLSGHRDDRYADLLKNPELDAAAKGPSLWSAFVDLIKARGFPVSFPDAQVASVVRIYSEPEHIELHALCEAMIEYDEQFRVWRARHALMAERMIGSKPGTGDKHTGQLVGRESFQEPGVRYLQSRVDIHFFPVLWEARTRMGSPG